MKSNNKSSFQPEISTTCTHPKPILPGLQLPLLSHNIPNTQISSRQWDVNSFALTRLQKHTLEASELLLRRIRDADIDLGDLMSRHTASICDFKRNGENLIPELGMAARDDCDVCVWIRRQISIGKSSRLQIAVVETGVR